MLTYSAVDNCIDIEDIGVTLRTLLAVGATGFKETGRRKWNIRYKGALIGAIQVASHRPPAAMTAKQKEAYDRRFPKTLHESATLQQTL